MVDIKCFLDKLNKKLHYTCKKRNGEYTARNMLPAFTLAEVLVGMLIMSLFFLATTKVISIKQKPLIQEHPHGYYECYNLGGLREHREDAGQDTIAANTPVGRCSFEPVKGIPVFNVYIAHQSQGFFATTESQMNEDNVTFSGADELVARYRATMDTDAERNSKFYDNRESRFNQFCNYLHISHPNSVLGSRCTGGTPPFNAVFIAW